MAAVHVDAKAKRKAKRKEVLAAALQRFGHTSWRPQQKRIVKAVLRGKQDILAILPTGGGKSLCYALPATLLCLADRSSRRDGWYLIARLLPALRKFCWVHWLLPPPWPEARQGPDISPIRRQGLAKNESQLRC